MQIFYGIRWWCGHSAGSADDAVASAGCWIKEEDNSLLGEFLVGCLLGSEKNDEG